MSNHIHRNTPNKNIENIHSKVVVADQPIDFVLAVTVFVLLSLGILMVFSTTAMVSLRVHHEAGLMIKQHLAHVVVGLVFGFAAFKVPPRLWYNFSWILFLGCFLLLVLTLIPGVGHVAGGARRWLVFGPLRFQPGELAKVASLVYFAAYIQRHTDGMLYFFSGVCKPGFVLCIVASLLLAEPDFGSTVVIVAIVFSQLLVFCRLKHLIIVGSLALCLLGMLVFFSPYRLRRFTTFLDPFHDPSAAGYQLIQSLIAVGSGGLSGAGLGFGRQKLFYLPAAHTDFIYAVIAEELGIFGAILVMLLFLLILYRGIHIASRLIDYPFLTALAIGCTALMVVPAVLNMGVVLGMLPTKGLVLPLVAYGGTSMLIHLVAIGILLRLSRLRQREVLL